MKESKRAQYINSLYFLKDEIPFIHPVILTSLEFLAMDSEDYVCLKEQLVCEYLLKN